MGPGLEGGGAEGRFSTLAKHLFGGAADVAVLTSGAIGPTTLGRSVLDLGWTGRNSYPKTIWALSRQLRARRYDVVMAFGLFPGLVAGLARVFGGRDAQFVYAEITRPLGAIRAMTGWRRFAYRHLWRLVARRFDLLSANSTDGLAELVELAGRQRATAVRLHNLMDPAQLARRAGMDAEADLPRRFLIWHGRLTRMKRVDTIVRAFARIHGEFPGVGLVLVGEGEARRDIEQLAARLECQDAVVFLGRKANPLPILSRSSGFVLASEHEGFSNAVLEAMFLDVPVITSFCSTDARRMCESGAALGFEVGDEVTLAGNMSKLLREPEVGSRLREAARSYRRDHELSISLQAYQCLLAELAGRRGT